MASKPAKPSLRQIASDILAHTLDTLIHNAIITEHRTHKLMLAQLDPTTRLLHCDRCKLPRLLDPPLAPKVRGTTTDPPANTTYCDLRPWSKRPGHDIYDNPFPKAEATGRPPTKKEREAAKAKQAAGAGGDGTPASEEANQGTGPPSPSENGEKDAGQDKRLEKGEKKANKIDEKLKKGEYIPWHTCPNCKRSLLITRFAKHLEQCMGISGRAAGRAAMAKLNSSTPQGSRAGTPGPSASQDGSATKEKVGPGDEDEEDEIAVKGPGNMKKKLLKKTLGNKIKKDKALKPASASANGKLPKGLALAAAAKRPPGTSSVPGARASPAPTEKRDRDEMLLGDEGDEDENVHVKKRQKLARVGSTTSVNSLAAGAGMERQDSIDGSFVDDAGSLADD